MFGLNLLKDFIFFGNVYCVIVSILHLICIMTKNCKFPKKTPWIYLFSYNFAETDVIQHQYLVYIWWILSLFDFPYDVSD